MPGESHARNSETEKYEYVLSMCLVAGDASRVIIEMNVERKIKNDHSRPQHICARERNFRTNR